MRTLLFAATIFAVGSAQAGIYKCVINGETIFSQQPCSPDAEAIQLKGYQTRKKAPMPATTEAQPATDETEPATAAPAATDTTKPTIAPEAVTENTPDTVEPEQEQQQDTWRSGPIHRSNPNR